MTESPIDLHAALLEHGPFLRRLARALVRDDADAEDLVQDTYAAALRARPRTDAGLGGWLRTTARNLAHSRRRRGTVRGRNVGVAPDPSDGGESERTVERLEAHALLHRALAELAEPWRTAVRLRFLEGLSAAEIGERTGAPPSTVRSRLRRGLADMRTTLDGLAGGGRAGRDRWLAALVPVAGGAATAQAKMGWAVPVAILALAGVGTVAWQVLGRSAPPAAGAPRSPLAAVDESVGPRPPALAEDGASGSSAKGTGLASVTEAPAPDRKPLGAGVAPPLDSPHVLVLDPDGRPVPDIGILFGDEAEPAGRRTDASELPRTDEWGRLALPRDGESELPHFASAETALGYRGTQPVSRERFTSVLSVLLREPRDRVPLAHRVELHVPHVRTLQLNVRHPEGGRWPRWTRTWLAADRAPSREAYGGGNARRLVANSSTYRLVPTGEPLEVHVDGAEGWLSETFELEALTPGATPKVVELNLATRRLVVRGRLVDEAGEPVREAGVFLVDRERGSTLAGALFGSDPDFPGAEREGRVRLVPGGLPNAHAGQLLAGLVAGPDHHWSREFTVRLPADIPDVDLDVGDIVLRERVVGVAGRATAPSGDPLPWCELLLWVRDPDEGWVVLESFMANGEGYFRLSDDLASESRPLAITLAAARGFRSDWLELTAPVPVEPGQRDVLVAPRPARSVRVQLRRSGEERLHYRTSITGPSSLPRPGAGSATEPQGLLRLLPGVYTFTATGPDGARFEETITVPSVVPGGMPPLEVWIDVE